MLAHFLELFEVLLERFASPPRRRCSSTPALYLEGYLRHARGVDRGLQRALRSVAAALAAARL